MRVIFDLFIVLLRLFNISITVYLIQLNCISAYLCTFFTPVSVCNSIRYDIVFDSKLFSQAAAIGGEGSAATMLVNKTTLKWTHHNYCLYYPSRSRAEAPARNWLTNYPICAWPIEIIVLVCSADMLTESYHSLWLKQSLSRCSQPTYSNWQLLVRLHRLLQTLLTNCCMKQRSYIYGLIPAKTGSTIAIKTASQESGRQQHLFVLCIGSFTITLTTWWSVSTDRCFGYSQHYAKYP